MANPFPFVAGAVLNADQLNGIGEAGTTYTPTVSAITGTVTTASATAKYVRINKLLFVSFTITCTTAGTATNGFNMSLPVGVTGALATGSAIGTNRENNVTAAVSFVTQNTTTNIQVICAPANGTSFRGSFTLEIV